MAPMCLGHQAGDRAVMTTSSAAVVSVLTTGPAPRRRPGRVRRIFLAAAAFLTCALPLVFTVNITRMLVTGVESDHQFHQATGQGLVLFVLWLGALVPLIRAGWRGDRPSVAAGYRHLAFVVVGAVCAALAPGGGAPILVGVIAVTGVLLWWALPQRPELRGTFEVHPVLMPVALLITAVLVPYAIDQLRLQNAATTGHHSQNPHLFDMAWLVIVVMVLALVGALVREARGAFAWVGGCLAATGTAGLVFGEPVVWSGAVLALGMVAGLAAAETRKTRP